MSDQNRGAYTPQSEAPLAFDARHSRGPGDRPMPITLLASAGVLVLMIVVFAFFFMRGTGGDETAAPEPIDAMKAAPPVAEAKPAEPTGLQVYADGDPIPETPAFTQAPEAPVARPTAPITVTPVTPPRTVTVTPPAPKPATPPAAARPDPAPVTPARPVETAPVARPNTPPPPTSSAQVQIGAFSSAAMAEDGWSEVAALLPGQMAGKTKRVEPVSRNGDTLYRASVGGFASRQEAAAFCEALKARSRACLVR